MDDREPSTTVSPLIFLALGWICLILSLCGFALSGSGPHVAGWLLASVLGLTMAGLTRRFSLVRVERGGNPIGPGAHRVLWMFCVVAFAIGMTHSWFVALEWA